jgi:hypothetical protein
VIPVYLWLLPLCFLLLHRGLRVQRAPGIPHALCRAEEKCTTRAHRAAGSERMFEIGCPKIR